MPNFEYKFYKDDSWDTCFHDDDCYQQVAEYICEGYDWSWAEYPDEREIWLRKEGDTESKNFVVTAENIRSYRARENKKED